MKNILQAGYPVLLESARRLLPVGVAVAVTLVSAVEPKPAETTEPKTHAFFMGADISVEQNKAFYRVQGVVGGSFVIKVDGREVKIPADWGAVKLKVDRSLKLTATSVSIDQLKVERAYTAGNDPVKKFMAQQGGAQAAEDAMATSNSQLDSARMMGNMMEKAIRGGSVEPGFPTGNVRALEVGVDHNFAASLSSFSKDNSMVGKMQDEIGAEQFDAIDVGFKVSSGKPMSNPYVVVMAQYRSPTEKPGELHNWIYASALDSLGAETRRFSVRKGGFPPGFILEKYQIHVFDGAQELGTNVAEKQVPLTQSEAFTYLMIDYVGSHKAATLPGKAVMGKLPAEARSGLSAEQFDRAYYVKISKAGLPMGAYLDTNCSQPVDETVAALAANVRFYPALEKGKPVEGVAELKFSRLNL